METSKKLESILKRLDDYYLSVNNKGLFFLGINTAILGFILTTSSEILIQTSVTWVFILQCILLLVCLLSLTFTLLSVIPFLEPGKTYNYSSLIFFGSISKLEFPNFHDSLCAQTDEEFNEDLIRQIYTLSIGLRKKFKNLKLAGWLIAIEFMVIIPISINMTLNS